MQERSFSWGRRWRPRDAGLSDPDAPNARSLAEWAGCRCVVLLGEGGLGKTHELAVETERLMAAGSNVFLCDLGTTTDRTNLRSELLPTLEPGEPATLLIDGFDEVFHDINDIADLLGDYLAGLDCSSVSVRIASRPVVWSTRLEARLGELWRGDVSILTLEPLTADDIRSAAESVLSSSDTARFLGIVGDRDLWFLARRPITLRFLLDQYCQSGGLDADRLTIHRDGIARLADETHERRLDRRRLGPPSLERVAAAQRLAYLSMFGGQPLIDTRRSPPGDGVDLGDVAGWDGTSQQTLDAVAQSGLFRPAGPTRVTWAHRSFAELLAADYVRSWPLPTLLNLLTQPTQPDTIAPPLVGVAGWVAVTHSALFSWLIDHDLAAVLDSNLADLPEDRRHVLTERLVDGVLAGRAFDWHAIAPGGLTTVQLTSRLRGLLTDPAVATDAKAQLVQLAWRSRDRGLDDVLVDIIREAAGVGAYDAVVSLGRWAAIALESCSDETALDALVDIARSPTTNRWIRADLLERLHPVGISAKEALDLLPADALAEMDTTFLGFVHHIESAARQDIATLVAFLGWLASQDDAAYHSYFLSESSVEALDLAAAHLDRPDVLAAVGRIIGRRAEVTHQSNIPDPLLTAPAIQRRRLLQIATANADRPPLVTHLIGPSLLNADDFDYFVNQLAQLPAIDAEPSTNHWITAALHAAFVHVPVGEQERMVEAAKTRHPQIAQLLEHQWGAEARQRRQRVLDDAQAADAQRRAEQTTTLFDHARLNRAIADRSWINLAQELRRPTDNDEAPVTRHGRDRRLSTTAAWKDLDQVRQDACIEIARSFVQIAPVDDSRSLWIADAVGLIADVQPDGLEAIDGARWLAFVGMLARWASHAEICALVISHAAAHDRATVDRTLLDALESNVATGHVLILDLLGDHVPVGLEQRLLGLALDDSVDAYVCGRLLSSAFALHPEGAVAAAFEITRRRPARPENTPSVVPTRCDSNDPEATRRRQWERAVAAGASLATAPAEIVTSDDLLAIVTTDWDFTRAVIAALGLRPYGNLFASLSSDEIAALYLWIDQFVDKPEHQPGRAFERNPVQEFPGTLLHVIGRREDAGAVAALDRIAEATNSRGVRQYASRVRHAAYASTWQPLPLDELRKIAADRDRRIIRTPQQLAVAARDVLAELGDQLRTCAARRHRFWHNQVNAGCWVPLNEEAASDQLKLELTDRLGRTVTTNREVRIEPRIGDQSASEVDLLVTAKGDSGDISCIIEVKANWYPRLLDRVRTQLADRYLKGPHGNAGIFVVLWFAGQNWCDSDPRRRKALKDQARLESGLAQATAEITDGYVDGLIIDCTLERHS